VEVRLHGIDTPERKQAFGTRARQFTSELAFNQIVTIIVGDTDRYGRLVAAVVCQMGAVSIRRWYGRAMLGGIGSMCRRRRCYSSLRQKPGPRSAGCGVIRTLSRPGSGVPAPHRKGSKKTVAPSSHSTGACRKVQSSCSLYAASENFDGLLSI
jgi:Staphylococcal nuclease homologue